ncbi:large neutral amino acid transporter [Fusarium agapanthi]|uniref:Large neutral amino acid transporter n=1 Tax=Fusarium agapanthi TaxID=1803897 RepID=A0A9P5AZ10_9HYPO|nr:large neutral amino acid transporter [Fusarium agapanthi]
MSSERAEDASQQPLLAEHRQADHDAAASRGTFTRNLGAVEAFGIVVSIVIGSGVFTSPGSIDTNVPSPGLALVIWLIGGVLAWTGATTFAELGTAIPGEGGVQPYLQHIYGDVWGFLAAWTWIVTVMPATLAILSIVFVESAYSAAGVINEDHRISHKLLSILVLVIMSVANSISTKASTRLNGFFVVLKFASILVVVMAALAVVGVHTTHPDKEVGGGDWFKKNWFEYRDTYNPNGPDTDWSKLSQWEIFGHYSAALYAALWAYSGWDKAIYVSAELSQPAKQLPLAINTSIPTAIICFLAANAGYYVLLPWDVVSTTDSVAVTALTRLLGRGFGIVTAVLICLVVAGSLLGNSFVASRMCVAAARKAWIPSLFTIVGRVGVEPDAEEAEESEDESTKEAGDAPINAVILSVILASFYILFGSFRALLTLNGLGEYSFFFLTVLGAIILRYREPYLERPYKTFSINPIVFVLVSGFVVVRGAIFAPVQAIVILVIWALGIAFYKIPSASGDYAVLNAEKWYHWYSPTDTPEEKKLILKLDLLLVPYAFVLYWVKYVDQTNINNAYVSGMAEDLDFHGNELVQFQTIFVVGNVVGLLPFIYLFPRVPMHILVPSLDLGWGIFTLLQYRATSYAEIMAYRFMVSLFEASYFPGVHFVLGSWYRSDEIGRRGGLFYVGLTLGTMTAGLLQGAATQYLDGHNGLAGWRWNFIINAIITLPLAFVGYFLWPGTPAKPNRLVMKKSEIALAKERLERNGTKVQSAPFSWTLLRRIFTSWQFYILIFWDILFFNTSANTAAFLLWIKSLDRYSTTKVNQLGSISPALGIFFVLFINFSADLWIGRPAAITLASVINFTGLVILAVWDVPEAAKWYAYSVGYSAVAVSSVLYGWANAILRHNNEERALTLILMTAIATSTQAWIPLLVYPTVEAPRFPKGYVYSATMVVLLVAMTQVIRVVYGSHGERVRARRVSLSDESEDGEIQAPHGLSIDKDAGKHIQPSTVAV